MNYTDAGYSVTGQVFDLQEMVQIRGALAGAELPRTKAGARHILRLPAIRSLATHPSLVNLAATFVGAQPIPFRATLFDKSAVSNWLVAWHQDTTLPLQQRVDDSSWGPWSVKGGVLHAVAPAVALASVVALRVHLDDSTPANGPLRVLPGTHAGGLLTHDDIQRVVGVVPPVEWLSPAGGSGRDAATLDPCVLQSERSSASSSRSHRILRDRVPGRRHRTGRWLISICCRRPRAKE
jgi:Phytanoyl-CoA dioxygenase (PhyH)